MSFKPFVWLDPARARLTREPRGLVLEVDGARTAGLIPRRAFPGSAPEGPVALCERSGRVAAMLPSAEGLAPESRAALAEALAEQTFAPEVLEVIALGYGDGSHHWSVRTAAGARTFTTRQRWNALPVARAASGALTIAGDDGVRYVIPDPAALDARSRRLLAPVL